MIRVLLDHVNQRKITIVDDIYITELLKSVDFNSRNHTEEVTKKITGALGIDIKRRKLLPFNANL